MKRKATYTQTIALGFLIIIITGAILLCLPIASRAGEWTSFFDALFTATSATCVTGLVVFDTYTHWSLFGQIVILMMIQIGGIGFMTLITMVSVFMGRRISLHERKLIMQSAGNTKISGAIHLVRRIILGTIMFEALGAVLLAFRLCPEMGILNGIYNAIFHSVSAFCNAGFDLMGRFAPGSSLMRYRSDPLINLTICGLITIGGLGFMVWGNIISVKGNYKRFSLHTKLVLTMTAILIIVPAVLFWLTERYAAFNGMSSGERLLSALFQTITPRTAGFNTVDQAALSESGSLLTTVLMLIGGSPGSTAGGIKTTTIAVMILTTIASARRNENVEVFKRRLSDNTLRQASAVFTVYMAAIVIFSVIICALEPFSLKQVLYEVSSAIGTVGLTTGITASLGTVSRFCLMLLMYAGRVGGLTLFVVLAENRSRVAVMRPKEEILIG